MQKVSKQSLAMIALSILLAISIALTFTFAVMGEQKTATGTIQFKGNVAVLVSGKSEAEGVTVTSTTGGWEFTLSDIGSTGDLDDALGKVYVGLAATSQKAYIKIKAEVTGTNYESNNPVSITRASELPTGYVNDSDKNTVVSKDLIEVGDAGKVALSALFSTNFTSQNVAVNTADGSLKSAEIKFTIDSDTTGAFSA